MGVGAFGLRLLLSARDDGFIAQCPCQAPDSFVVCFVQPQDVLQHSVVQEFSALVGVGLSRGHALHKNDFYSRFIVQVCSESPVVLLFFRVLLVSPRRGKLPSVAFSQRRQKFKDALRGVASMGSQLVLGQPAVVEVVVQSLGCSEPRAPLIAALGSVHIQCYSPKRPMTVVGQSFVQGHYDKAVGKSSPQEFG